MGHIAIVTPPRKRKGIIPRRKVSDSEIFAESQIERHYYAAPKSSKLDVTFQKLKNMVTNRNETHHHTWSHMYMFARNVPMWKGYMTQFYEQVKVYFTSNCHTSLFSYE